MRCNFRRRVRALSMQPHLTASHHTREGHLGVCHFCVWGGLDCLHHLYQLAVSVPAAPL